MKLFICSLLACAYALKCKRDKLYSDNLELALLQCSANTEKLFLSNYRFPELPMDMFGRFNITEATISKADDTMDSKYEFPLTQDILSLTITESALTNIEIMGPHAIQELNLVDNYLTEISPTIAQNIPELETLNLRSNQIQSMEATKSMKNLVNLELSYNNISKFYFDGDEHFEFLNYLSLYGNPINDIFINAGKNKALKVLTLSYMGEIATAMEQTSKLDGLEFLQISADMHDENVLLNAGNLIDLYILHPNMNGLPRMLRNRVENLILEGETLDLKNERRTDLYQHQTIELHFNKIYNVSFEWFLQFPLTVQIITRRRALDPSIVDLLDVTGRPNVRLLEE